MAKAQTPDATVIDQVFRLAKIPIDGISLVDPKDRTTWRVDYPATATAQDRADGAALLANIDQEIVKQADVLARAHAHVAIEDPRIVVFATVLAQHMVAATAALETALRLAPGTLGETDAAKLRQRWAKASEDLLVQ